MSQESKLLDAALMYAKNGWHIFPCKPGCKEPMTQHGCKDATVDEAQIKAWWGKCPDANIGLLCGEKSGVAVVDIDVKDGKDGWKTLKQFPDLPETITQMTPTGGAHKIYRITGEPPKNRNGFPTKKDGIDIRSTNYYIMLSPSIHPNGKPYVWAEGYSPWQISIADYPDCMRPENLPTPKHAAPLEKNTQGAAKVSAQARPAITDVKGPPIMERARLYLKECKPAVQGNAGHDSLLWAARSLVIGFEMNDATAISLLWDEFNPRCVPPWNRGNPAEVKDFERKVRQAQDTPCKKQRGWLLDDMGLRTDHEAMRALGAQFAANLAGDKVSINELANRQSQKAYSVRPWGEVASMEIPPLECFLGDCFALGYGRVRVHAIFGQGGLGKSRISLNMARNQVLGLDFGGMPMGNRPLKHLLMGTENSIHRLRHDIEHMQAGLSDHDKALLNDHIILATLEFADDAYVTLGDKENLERWVKTIEKIRPDVLWVDPWGDVQIGEVNSETDTRKTISELIRIVGGVNPNAALVILAHARTGISNIAQAVGFEGANFGKGSKALYSCARSVFNLAPGSEDESPPIIMACAKNSDGVRPPPFCVVLDQKTMTYDVDPNFNVDEWTEGILSRSSGRGSKPKPRRLSTEEAVELLGNKVDSTSGIKQLLRDTGVTREHADDLVKKIISSGGWESWRPSGKNQPTYIGPLTAIKQKRDEWAEQQQRKMPVV